MKVFYNDEIFLNTVRKADNFNLRAMGLMFKADMGEMDGLLLEPCNSIHTFFMKFNIDVVFIGRENKVVKIFRDMPPWRITRMYFTSMKVLEMEAGKLPPDLQEGERLEFKYV